MSTCSCAKDGRLECSPPCDNWFQPVTLEVEFKTVDPEALGILTGGVMGTPPSPTFSIDINFPVKRTFWQWLRRKPRQWRRIHVPNARLDTGKEDLG